MEVQITVPTPPTTIAHVPANNAPVRGDINIHTIDVSLLERKVKETMNENGHAIISPSAASIWMNCIGSCIGLNEHRAIAEDNVASVEGTCAHMLLELALIGHVSPLVISHIGTGDTGVCPSDQYLDDADSWYQRIVNKTSNTDEVMEKAEECYTWATEVTFPPDMRHEVAKTYDLIMEYVADGWTMIPEMKVKLAAYFGHSQCDGTSDVILYKGTEMIVVDLKYGISIEVSPEENKQMRIYAGGAVDHLYKTTGVVVDKLTLVISQSRINDGVWKAWETTYSDLYKWLMEVVKPASIKALYALANPDESVEGWYVPSQSACQWCHRKKTCAPRKELFKEKTIAAFQIAMCEMADSFRPKPFNPDTIGDDELGELLDQAPFIISWLKDAEKEALVRTKKGRDISGRKMVLGRMTKSWPTKKEAVMAKKFAALGVAPDQMFNVKLKSPAQIQNSNIDPEIKKEIKKLVVETRGQDVMALANDTRELINDMRKAQNEFAKALIKS